MESRNVLSQSPLHHTDMVQCDLAVSRTISGEQWAQESKRCERQRQGVRTNEGILS